MTTADRFEQIPIAQLAPSTTNPRRHFPEDDLAQLAASIVEKGIIEPLVVRQVDAGSHHPMAFEIVAGERRYRAATLADLAVLPCVIREYTDEQVLEVQLIENLHRNDLTPLEQARGYRALIASNPTPHEKQD